MPYWMVGFSEASLHFCPTEALFCMAGFPNASQEDFKIEKTAKSAQKGLEKAAQNEAPNTVTGDTSELPNPFDGAGGLADKVMPGPSA